MVYWSLALVAIPCALYYYLTRTFNFWKNQNVVSPNPIPLFGNIYESAVRKSHTSEVFHKLYNEFPKEKIVGIYRMTTPCLLIRDLDIIKHVMIKDFDVFVDRGNEVSKEGLGANLFHADGDSWRALRNRLTPIFTSGKLKNMLHLMLERGDIFTDYVSRAIVEKPEQEVLALLQKFFMSNISACAFGLDLDTINGRIETLEKIDKVVFNMSFLNELDMMYPNILRKLSKSFFPKFVDEFFYGLVKEVSIQRKNTPSSRKDFMDLLLELKQQGDIQSFKRNDQDIQTNLEITDDLLAAQAFVFYVAGYETSSTILSFLLYQIALNPDIQTKLQAEIDVVLAEYNGEVTYEALQDMKYLEKVFNETLRMYPVVDPLIRNAIKNYEIPGTDVFIKKGQTVLVSAQGIHYDENIWPNPHVFDPERFSPENCGKRHPCAFLAFGVGPRNCIGMRFSKVSSRVCLVKLLSKFNVQPTKNTKRKMEFSSTRFVLTPNGGIPLNIVPRI